MLHFAKFSKYTMQLVANVGAYVPIMRKFTNFRMSLIAYIITNHIKRLQCFVRKFIFYMLYRYFGQQL